MKDENPWTPYALEPLRSSMRRRRFALGLVAIFVFAAGWIALSASDAPQRDMEILVNGEKGGLEIKAPDQKGPAPVTVKVEPGRIIAADPSPLRPTSTIERAPIPAYEPDVFAWSKLLRDAGPLLLLGSILWLVGRTGDRPRDQVNFGIYKGALPLEMHTATHRHLVVTGRTAERSIFGKAREDYVPREAYVPSQQMPAGVVFGEESGGTG